MSLIVWLPVLPTTSADAAEPKEKKLSAELTRALASVVKRNAAELIESHGPTPTDEQIEAFLTKKGAAKDSPVAVRVRQAIAVHRELVESGLAQPGTELFNELYAEMVGLEGAKPPEPAALVTREAINSFVTPTERFEAAQEVAEEREKYLAGVQAGRTDLRPVSADDIPYVSDFGTHAMLGVKLLSPYQIITTPPPDGSPEGTPPTKTLESSSSEPGAFLEFAYTNRWAWRDERIRAYHTDDPRLSRGRAFWQEEGGKPHLDGEIRFGYSFNSDSGSDAAQIVGSGQFYADVLFGVGFYRGEIPGGAYSFNLELGGGVVTDASAYNSTSRFFVGPGFATQLPGFFGFGDPRRRPSLVAARFGYGWWELPEFADSTSRRLRLRRGDLVDFGMDGGLALELEALLPVRDESFLGLGGRVYGTDPNIWSLYLGLTTDLQSLVESFTGGK